ncbi:hypothetical protein ZHAS_00006453 [Anopheles sinensis]|uniref:PIH1_CS domain-containing protein n=1 Tax=Anopheles sinensis TaxID=74873 RepID=A0A084VMD0_ANOSI|nr:hypothetical protein ZHAS_00006453 [Anopheles sinensis]
MRKQHQQTFHNLVRKAWPGDIGELPAKPRKKASTDGSEHVKPCSYTPLEAPVEVQPKTLEEWELEQQKNEDHALLESRRQPQYRISYRQTVATEDIYLQMNCKTPSTASCENMIVEILFPEEDATIGVHHIELSVKEQCVTVETPKYFLNLVLPHKIDPDKGNAAWHSDQKTLQLTLRMVRELDFVNF